jgi:hypothetical protein
MNNGCLINVLSLIAGFIGLVIGVTLQVLIVGEGGPEAIGMGLVIVLTFGAYRFAKKKFKNYFNFQDVSESLDESIERQKKQFSVEENREELEKE